MFWIYSQVLEDSALVSSELACKQSPSASETSSAEPSLPNTGLEFPASLISATLGQQRSNSSDQLDWCAEDSPVSPSPSPASELGVMMSATSGPQCAESLNGHDPLGSFSKTLLGSSRWGSTAFCLTWKVSGTPRGRLLFRLVPSMRDTDGIESGSLPRIYPTLDLGAAKGRGIKSAAGRSRLGGTLNPRWGEWLLGFPDGWTDLSDSETPLSPKSSKSSDAPSCPPANSFDP